MDNRDMAAFELRNLGSVPDYLEYVDCFNGGRYYEAHDALEPLWLRVRQRPEGQFLKGLIQLAGAFVHVQQGRPGPAQALLARAQYHLELPQVEAPRVEVGAILDLIQRWRNLLDQVARDGSPLTSQDRPALPRTR
jgi:hypothetical protein